MNHLEFFAQRCRKNTEHDMPRIRTIYATNWFSRLRGLIATSAQDWRDAELILRRCSAVHTFGMRYALDIAFFDARNRIVATHTAVAPNRFVIGPRSAQHTIERPAQRSAWYRAGDRVGRSLT